MVRLSYFGLGQLYLFGAPIHMSRDNDTYTGLHKSSDWVWSSIRKPMRVYVYLRVDLGTLDNSIIFVRPVPYIHILLAASSVVASS